MPLVSIIIPAYNAEKYIDEAVESVLAQTYSNWELIIVNDGSTDSTPLLADEWAKKDQRISVIHKANSGVSDTRNKGMEIAQGEYIAFLDADDVWDNENIRKKLKILENYDVAYSWYQNIDEKSVAKEVHQLSAKKPLLNDILSLNGKYSTAPSGLLFKKYILNKIGDFDVRLSNNADQDIWMRVLSNGGKIRLVEEVLWKYRIHKKNMSKNIAVFEHDSLYLMKKAQQNKLFTSFWFKKRCFSNLYLILAGSWWKDANNKKRGSYFMLKAICAYPPNIIKLFKKLF